MSALKEAITAYTDPALRLTKFLVLGGNDGAAVSDGTMNCHVKDVHHLIPIATARGYLQERMLLETVLLQIADCDKIAAQSKEAGFEPGDTADIKLRYVTGHLNDTLTFLKDLLDPGYVKVAEYCLELRSADVWSKTPYDKAVTVRARKTIQEKNKKELFVQNYVIKEMEGRFPPSIPGYCGELGQAILRTKKSYKQHLLPVVHFAFATLATIHKAFANSAFTHFEITRVQMEVGDKDRTTTSLRRAYSLHFRHIDGKFVYAEELTPLEMMAGGTAYVMESKVYPNQEGDGFASSDDNVWLEAVKRQPAVVLLSYLFCHSAYPDGEDTGVNIMELLKEISGASPPVYNREAADQKLGEFDFRGDLENFSLITLAAAALVPRPDLGAGNAKYIDTKRTGFAFEEPTKAVGLNVHHIYTTTGLYTEAMTNNCNRRHKALGYPKLSTKLVVAHHYAMPIGNPVQYNTMLDVFDEGRVYDTDIIMNAGCESILFPVAY